MFKKDTIFDIARKTGKKIVFIIFEDKVFVTLAEKKVDGTCSFLIRRGYKSEKYDLQIQPEQEFVLHSPKVVIGQNIMANKDVYDYILNFDINVETKNPKDIIFQLQPYDVECMFLIYPHEVLNVDTLKNLGLVEVNDVKKEVIEPDGTKRFLTLKAYSPTIFALDKQTVKMLSAKSRISQIDTILSMMRDLLLRSEGLFGVEKPRILSLLFNWKILLPTILLFIALIAAVMLSRFMGGLTQTLGGATVPRITPTFP